MILVLAPHGDDHAVPVVDELRRRGERVSVFDLAELPQRASITLRIEPGEPMEAVVDRATDSFSTSEVDAVWLRRTTAPDPPGAGDPSVANDRWFALSETRHLLVGLAQALAGKRWVNPLHSLALDGGWGRVRQLQAAREVGLEVPRTCMTSSSEEARQFVASCHGGAIYKPFQSPEGTNEKGERTAIYTTLVTTDRDFSGVAHSACIFQERVPKLVEVRATVMGDRVFACEIDSQANPALSVDFRHAGHSPTRRPHDLPWAVEQRVLAWHRALGLVFGSCDLIYTPDDRYVALETNQQGQWLWTSEAFHAGALLRAFCDLLCGTGGAR